MGNMPKILFKGRHTVPNKNFAGPISPIAGTPLANRKTHIKTTANMHVQAAVKNTVFIIFSLNRFIITPVAAGLKRKA
jgi:hypothetical protein